MSWFPVQHSILTNGKFLGLGADASWWIVCAWAFADLNATDGVIRSTQVGELAPSVRGKAGERAAERCAEVGLLDAHPDGWLIHSWGEHQRPAAEVKAARDAARERQRKRRSHAASNGIGHAP